MDPGPLQAFHGSTITELYEQVAFSGGHTRVLLFSELSAYGSAIEHELLSALHLALAVWAILSRHASCLLHLWYIRVPFLVCLGFFPKVFLHSRVTGACPVTMDSIMRVNVTTTATTATRYWFAGLTQATPSLLPGKITWN